MKKKDGKPDSNGTKKNLQFVGVNGGWDWRALKSIISTFKGDLTFIWLSDVCWSLSPPCGPRYETTSSDDSSSEDSSSTGSDEEEEEVEKEWQDKEELKDVEGKNTGEEIQSEGVEDVDKKDEIECSEKQEMRERWGER